MTEPTRSEPIPCPLCAEEDSAHYHRDKRRDYYQCPRCELVFVPSEQLLSPEEEKAHYDLHENHPEDAGYRKFLGRIFDPMMEIINPGSQGLDFGSGPGPTLSLMFEEKGHTMAIYDPFFSPDTSPLQGQYDFITTTEVVEHLHNPGKELDRLWDLLKPEGALGIMTKLVLSPDAFSRWHYKNDPTHVIFFSEKTFRFLASRWNARVIFPHKDVILFRKNP